MTHLLLVAASVGLLGMTSGQLQAGICVSQIDNCHNSDVCRTGAPLTHPEKQAAKAPQLPASTLATVVTMPEAGPEIRPGMAELFNTATLYPQIGLVVFFLLSVFAVLRAAGKSPRW